MRIGNLRKTLELAEAEFGTDQITVSVEPKGRPSKPTPSTLTPPQVAKRYGVTADTVRGWIVSGQLRAVNVSNATRPRYRIEPDALRDFDKTRQVTKTKPAARRPKRGGDGLIVTRF